MVRKGFSLIETLFAIVVMALIVTPIPTLLTTINISVKAIQSKDIIFRTVFEMMNISSYRWDKNSESVDGSRNKILETNSSNFKRGSELINTRNFGKLTRRFFDKNDVNKSRMSATPFKYFNDSGEILYSDIDDWNQKMRTFNNFDKKLIDFAISFRVFYIKDTGSGNNFFSDKNSTEVILEINRTSLPNSLTSNLKYIEVIGEENSSNINRQKFVLHYISANLGEEPNQEYRKIK